MITNTKLAEAIELAEDAMAYVPEYFANKHGMNRRMAAIKEAAAHDAEQAQKPLAWVPADCIARLAPPLLVLGNVPLYTYAAEGLVPVYAAPTEQAARTSPVHQPVHGWTDADADAARLALELECLLTDGDVPMPVASRWWESAHDALALHRQRLESERAAAPQAAQPEPFPDTEAVTACWQDFGRTEDFRRAVKWSQDGEIPGALFVAFRAGLRAASPKALCDCGKKPAAECDKWEPGCDLGQSPEHARVVRLDKAQAAPEAQQAAGQELPSLPYPQLDSIPAFTEPGYTADQMRAYARAALAQHREPLTDDDAYKIAAEYFNQSWYRRVATEVVRATERAHGIGATTGEQR